MRSTFVRHADSGHVGASSRIRHAHSANGRTTLLHMIQRTHGNQHVQRMLAVARQQDAGEPAAGADIEAAIEQSRGGGQPLDGTIRGRMERAFGTDFRAVRAHTDARADKLARSLGAVAFTTGRDVYFRSGAYDAGSGEGRHLLAHELAHVVQHEGTSLGSPVGVHAQRLCPQCEEEAHSAIHPKLTVSDPQDADEVEAEAVADRVTRLLDADAPEAYRPATAANSPRLAILGRGLAIARAERADAAVDLLERSMDVVRARPDDPLFALAADRTSGCSCRARQQVAEATRGHAIQRAVATDRIARQARRTPIQCINNALASAGIPWATLAILGAVCGGIGAIAGLAGGPAAPATSPSAAAVAIAVCWAGVTGLTVGFILGVIIDCIRNPEGEWIFAEAGGGAGAGGAEAAPA
jgi:Domain of unknown function (DUF4157)